MKRKLSEHCSLAAKIISVSRKQGNEGELTLTPCFSFQIQYAVTGGWWLSKRVRTQSTHREANPYLTCSDTSWVVPASSSHRPRKSSPRKGFRGFFSDPNLSLLLLYCCFKVLKNHFKTNNARFAGSGSEAGATKIEGCSVQ